MTKNKIKTAVNRIPEAKILLALTSVLTVVLFIYAYFIANTVLNVVARKEIQAKVSEMNSEISEVEEKYISMQNSITKEYALSLGFRDVADVSFVSYKNGGTELTLGN